MVPSNQHESMLLIYMILYDTRTSFGNGNGKYRNIHSLSCLGTAYGLIFFHLSFPCKENISVFCTDLTSSKLTALYVTLLLSLPILDPKFFINNVLLKNRKRHLVHPLGKQRPKVSRTTYLSSWYFVPVGHNHSS